MENSSAAVLYTRWVSSLTRRAILAPSMTLSPGTTLGPYSITAKIGEDGMGCPTDLSSDHKN